MSFVLTYDSLISTIPQYLERNDADILNNLPVFIKLATDRLSTDLKILGLENYVQGSFSVGQSVYQKPVDWRNTLSITYGTGTGFNTSQLMELRSFEYLRKLWPDATQTSPPLYYADYGYSHWLIAPTPDQAYPFEIAYSCYLSPIDSTQQTNWATSYAPELYINAVMLEAMIFVKDDQRTQYFMNLYNTLKDSFLREQLSRLTDRSQDIAKG